MNQMAMATVVAARPVAAAVIPTHPTEVELHKHALSTRKAL